ncbi:MAG: hypothetical protein J7M26_09390, partial [Armatimonadetes bacterium]|nr:hypothetical protein [Armatimonadota bacterium]
PGRVRREWECRLEVRDGCIVGAEKCWSTPGQSVGELGGSACEFGFTTQYGAGQQGVFGFRTPLARGQATVFEIEARPRDRIFLDLDGWKGTMTLAEAAAGARVAWFGHEVREYLRQKHGLDPDALPRPDPFYFLSHKAKIHRAIPEAGYSAEYTYTDEAPPEGRNHYRVRVYQRNGAMAWSSPVWVDNG